MIGACVLPCSAGPSCGDASRVVVEHRGNLIEMYVGSSSWRGHVNAARQSMPIARCWSGHEPGPTLYRTPTLRINRSPTASALVKQGPHNQNVVHAEGCHALCVPPRVRARGGVCSRYAVLDLWASAALRHWIAMQRRSSHAPQQPLQGPAWLNGQAPRVGLPAYA